MYRTQKAGGCGVAGITRIGPAWGEAPAPLGDVLPGRDLVEVDASRSREVHPSDADGHRGQRRSVVADPFGATFALVTLVGRG